MVHSSSDSWILENQMATYSIHAHSNLGFKKSLSLPKKPVFSDRHHRDYFQAYLSRNSEPSAEGRKVFSVYSPWPYRLLFVGLMQSTKPNSECLHIWFRSSAVIENGSHFMISSINWSRECRLKMLWGNQHNSLTYSVECPLFQMCIRICPWVEATATLSQPSLKISSSSLIKISISVPVH